jgi:hypothetical protein
MLRKLQIKYQILMAISIVATLSMYLIISQSTSIKLREKFQVLKHLSPFGENSTNSSDIQMENDFQTLIDLKEFKFILNPPRCSELKEKPKVVALIVSGASHFENREMIRETWGKAVGKMFVLFLLGAVEKVEDQWKLDEEFQVSTIKLSVTLMVMQDLCRFMAT